MIKRVIMVELCGGFCREAAIEYGPGLQPWVGQIMTGAPKVAPDVGAVRRINPPTRTKRLARELSICHYLSKTML
jgi:hypothetical protein